MMLPVIFRRFLLENHSSKTGTAKWIEVLLEFILIVGAVSYVLIYFYIVFSRIWYPFELEWMEGGSFIQVTRIVQGDKLYVPPSLEYVPFIYPPLYFYLSAVAANIIGNGFMPLRLISFFSSLGYFSLIFLIVYRETSNKFSAIIATCLFVATYQIAGAWFDIGRVDSLFLFFLLAGIYLLRIESKKAVFFAAVFFSLAFFTKQTTLFVFLPIAFYYLVVYRGRSSILISSTLLITGLGTLFLNYIYDGWYKFYVFDLPSRHRILLTPPKLLSLVSTLDVKNMVEEFAIQKFWIEDILQPLPIACLIALFYFLLFDLSNSRAKKSRLFYFIVAVSMVGASWVSRINPGGYNNVLMPMYATISILFGLGLYEAQRLSNLTLTSQYLSPRLYLYLICIIQFAMLSYSISDQIPTQRDLKTGRELVSILQEIEGDVWMPFNGYLAVLASKKSSAHDMALCELKGCFGGDETEICRIKCITN